MLHSFFGHDEKSLLQDFFGLLDRYPNAVLCGHNSKEFDIPYCCRRATIHGIAFPPQLRIRGKKPREIDHIDTLELRKFGDYKNYTSLALLCEIFQIPTSKDDIDGSDVGRVYREEDDLNRIVSYCEKDVVAAAQLYKKMLMLS